MLGVVQAMVQLEVNNQSRIFHQVTSNIDISFIVGLLKGCIIYDLPKTQNLKRRNPINPNFHLKWVWSFSGIRLWEW